jgi:hypothetical protein
MVSKDFLSTMPHNLPSTFIPPLTASDLFALSQGSINDGKIFKCHWCGSPCGTDSPHDDVAPIPFVRSKSTAKCPSQPYICCGCYLWKRPRVSINFLGGTLTDEKGVERNWFRDGQSAQNHSWWITEQGAWAIERLDHPLLWDKLLHPPKRFVLAFKVPEQKNLLQLLVANDPGGIVGDTPLYFTQGGTKYSFSVYELEEAIRYNPTPYGPGVNALFKIMGEVPKEVKKKYPKPLERKVDGRPPALPESRSVTKKVITASGEGKEAA